MAVAVVVQHGLPLLERVVVVAVVLEALEPFK
jgi:hypothetical protein